MPQHLRPERHPQRDFFVADLVETTPKDDNASMEHPLFALRAGDHSVRTYGRNGNTVEIQPGAYGCATIHDKDIWIYAISQLIEGHNQKRDDLSRTIRFTAYDFLIATNRPTNNMGYNRLAAALDRLAGTRIATNIETAGRRERQGFGLIDSYRIVERDGRKRMVAIEITLPDWLYRAINARQVLTLNPDYFCLRKPLDRRIYELVRKHCGKQSRWAIGVRTLHEKSGSRAALKKFRHALKSLASSDELPDYTVTFDTPNDCVVFYPRNGNGHKAQFKDMAKRLLTTV